MFDFDCLRVVLVLKWYNIPLLILLGWLFDSLKARIPVNVEHCAGAREAAPRPGGAARARRARRPCVFRALMRYDEISRQIKLGHAVRSHPKYSL